MNHPLFIAINKKYKMKNLFPRTFDITQENIDMITLKSPIKVTFISYG